MVLKFRMRMAHCMWIRNLLSRTASLERGRRCEEKFVDGKFHEIRPPTSEVDFGVQNRVLTPNKVHNRVQHIRIDLYSYLVGVRGATVLSFNLKT